MSKQSHGHQVAESKKPDIYAYHDHRLFLPAWFQFLQKNKKGFSMRKLAVKTGLAIGYLPSVMSGKIRISEKGLQKIIRHLGLSVTEQSFLILMHTLTDTDDADLRLQALKKMQAFSGYQKINAAAMEKYRYWTHWFYPVVREMAALSDFKMNATYIQQKLRDKVPLHEIEQALTFLRDYGFLKVDAKGLVAGLEEEYLAQDGVHRISLGQFHREMLQKASQSIDKVDRSQRSITGEVLALREEDWDEVQKILEDTRKKIAQLARSKQDASHVYHVALAAFPLTKKEDS